MVKEYLEFWDSKLQKFGDEKELALNKQNTFFLENIGLPMIYGDSSFGHNFFPYSKLKLYEKGNDKYYLFGSLGLREDSNIVGGIKSDTQNIYCLSITNDNTYNPEMINSTITNFANFLYYFGRFFRHINFLVALLEKGKSTEKEISSILKTELDTLVKLLLTEDGIGFNSTNYWKRTYLANFQLGFLKYCFPDFIEDVIENNLGN